MTVYNILSSLEPEQEEQAFHSPGGKEMKERLPRQRPSPDAAVCFGVPTIPSSPCGLQTLPTLCEFPPASLVFAFLSLEWMKT